MCGITKQILDSIQPILIKYKLSTEEFLACTINVSFCKIPPPAALALYEISYFSVLTSPPMLANYLGYNERMIRDLLSSEYLHRLIFEQKAINPFS